MNSILNKTLLFGIRTQLMGRLRPPRLLHTSQLLRLPSWGPPRPPVDRQAVEFRVLQCLSNHDKVDKNSLRLSSHLNNDLGLDSLDLIEICVQLEDEFAVEVTDSSLDKISSVDSVVALVVDLLNALPDENRRPEIEFKEGMRKPDMS